MVVGFNHNIRYKGELFHVQTEDSGLANPHIITLLYRGGTILASAKTSYADIVKAEQLELVVESIMKEQHKNMMRRLKAGEFDARIFPDGVPHGAEAAPSPAASATAGGPAPSAPVPKADPPPSAASAPPAPHTPAATPAAANSPTAPPTAAPAPAGATGAGASAQPTAATDSRSATAGQQLAASVKQQLAAASQRAAAAASERRAQNATMQQGRPDEKGTGTSGAGPQAATTQTPPTKRSLDEVILDYLITGEEK